MVLLNLIASINQNFTIGVNNDLLIKSKEDLSHFYKVTTTKYPEGNVNILIMGYNTWLSIPEKNKPLKKRMNLIITKNHKDEIIESENIKAFTDLYSCLQWCDKNPLGKVFVIGGETIYNQCYEYFSDNIKSVYLTKFMDNYLTGGTQIKRFNHCILQNKTIVHKKTSELSQCLVNEKGSYYPQKMNINYLTFESLDYINKGEYQYLNLLKRVMDEGIHGHTRNGKTRSLFAEKMVFDMKDGFPLLTTKQMGYKTILRELLWFIRGSTSNKELVDKNVHIWNQNSTREFLDSRNLNYEEGDLGPVYGFQWRHSGAEYVDCHTDYTGQGIDQLKNVIDLIKNDPHSRRIIMNAWNPIDLDKMALPPCHVMCQFHVDSEKRTLNCQLYQRSGDMFLGVPFNIASYSFLLHIIAYITRYKPGKLTHILGDTHIYEDHFDAVNQQLERVPISFPDLAINGPHNLDIDNLSEDMFTIKNYKSYEKISAPMIA
jgi:dihydrofolate reductase / thymidylate synthase